jgi:hypothetical protein
VFFYRECNEMESRKSAICANDQVNEAQLGIDLLGFVRGVLGNDSMHIVRLLRAA